mmetsp:Transcript_21025/g.43839  ORF Transcript_21025/g.43839 Transcript_21025/m.43839 type:complete len:213 (+) Transcript_21025:1256-1894(+)
MPVRGRVRVETRVAYVVLPEGRDELLARLGVAEGSHRIPRALSLPAVGDLLAIGYGRISPQVTVLAQLGHRIHGRVRAAIISVLQLLRPVHPNRRKGIIPLESVRFETIPNTFQVLILLHLRRLQRIARENRIPTRIKLTLLAQHVNMPPGVIHPSIPCGLLGASPRPRCGSYGIPLYRLPKSARLRYSRAMPHVVRRVASARVQRYRMSGD